MRPLIQKAVNVPPEYQELRESGVWASAKKQRCEMTIIARSQDASNVFSGIAVDDTSLLREYCK